METFRRKVWSRIERRFVVYRLDPAAVPQFPPGTETYACYRTMAEIPAAAHDLASGGIMPPAWFEGRFAEGAHVWCCWDQERLVACLWSKTGRARKRWFVQINADDRIIYSVITHPNIRGRGYAPRLTAYAVLHELTGENAVYLDCRLWNRTAQRVFERIGFRRIAIAEPGPRVPVNMEPERFAPVESTWT